MMAPSFVAVILYFLVLFDLPQRAERKQEELRKAESAKMQVSQCVEKVFKDVRIEDIDIQRGDISRPYNNIGKITAKVGQGSKLTNFRTIEDVNLKLREDALKQGANVVLNVKYDRVGGGFWGKPETLTATGTGVYAESEEVSCPYCAELLKRQTVKCKHCGSSIAKEDSISVAPSYSNASDKTEPKAVRSEDVRKRGSESKSKEPRTLRVRCRCNAILNVKSSLSGKAVKCPRCGYLFTIS